MIEETENIPLAEIRKDHFALTEKFTSRKITFLTLRLQFAIWLKSKGRVATIYLAMVIGLALFWASGGLSKDLYPGSLTSLVAVMVVFGVIRYGVHSS